MRNELPLAARTLAHELGVTAVVVARYGDDFVEWGDTHKPVNLRSVRKSLLSGLYGAASAEKPLDLATTLAELGVSDRDPALSEAERQASIRDLLMARSGIYHPAAYESAGMKAKRPPRGRHPPNSFWYYNNWDFNTLGVIYERITGEDVFESFERRIAAPIGMEDYSASAGIRVFDPASDHPAHVFHLSAFDLARFGLLFLDGGRWAGKQVLPASWIRELTTAYSRTDTGRLGYGYLWWIAPPDGPFGAGAHFALGAGGQGLAVLPQHGVAVAQVVERAKISPLLTAEHFLRLVRLIVDPS